MEEEEEEELAPDLGVSQQASTIYALKPPLCSCWGCLPHPEVEFHARRVTFLSSFLTNGGRKMRALGK